MSTMSDFIDAASELIKQLLRLILLPDNEDPDESSNETPAE